MDATIKDQVIENENKNPTIEDKVSVTKKHIDVMRDDEALEFGYNKLPDNDLEMIEENFTEEISESSIEPAKHLLASYMKKALKKYLEE